MKPIGKWNVDQNSFNLILLCLDNFLSTSKRTLFGYDGQSNDLKVISTGKYGLDELQQEFNPGKVLFAFVKVLNPKSNLPCFITISWVGKLIALNYRLFAS